MFLLSGRSRSQKKIGRLPESPVDIRPLGLHRWLTGRFRALPDFLVIGTQRSGSTSLYFNLTQHPCILSACHKEVHFFDRSYGKGVHWYRRHFPTIAYMKMKAMLSGQPVVTGEATPAYLFHPLTPARVKALMPQIKLIALLRNPVERAYSQYQMNVKRRFEKLSFEEGIDTESQRMAADLARQQQNEMYFGIAHRRYSYLQRGLYADQLERWFACFDRSQFLILDSRDFAARPQDVLEQVVAFLNLPGGHIQKYESHHVAKYSGMAPETRARLVEFFRPHNQRLYQLLGHDFGWE